ncbi:Hypothetical predicted protein [Prunus dulcis]|uniref:Uncharacterized protein n=1 Tax=Prunus dulcis TaxID=3755 RepID=A0A5E4FL99_PRUDU|nr:Hypothetical predicted protein [Prunus dulcis]
MERLFMNVDHRAIEHVNDLEEQGLLQSPDAENQPKQHQKILNSRCNPRIDDLCTSHDQPYGIIELVDHKKLTNSTPKLRLRITTKSYETLIKGHI